MPVCTTPFLPPKSLRNGHVQTIVHGLLRRIPDVHFRREVWHTADGDFLHLDRLDGGHPRIAILSHGLEGSTRSPYVRGMARALFKAGWDVLAWNNRGCSGTPNRRFEAYHSGYTEDLEALTQSAASRYPTIVLIGFSMGGNITLKYVATAGSALPAQVKTAIAISAPVDLGASSAQLETSENRLYLVRFMRSLKKSMRARAALHPGKVDLDLLARVNDFYTFDDRFTAPMFGFASAEDYYRRSSSLPLLERIPVPTLLLNAQDDPFLPHACYPFDLAAAHPHLHLDAPDFGGHCAFLQRKPITWSEERALAWLSDWA